MVNMATMMLRGLGEILQQSRNLAEVWRPIARQALAEKGRLAEVEAEIASWSTTANPVKTGRWKHAPTARACKPIT